MGEVRNISADLVTPLDVITDVQNNLGTIKELYCVAFDQDGRPIIWASGNLKSMAMAVIALQSKTIDFINER